MGGEFDDVAFISSVGDALAAVSTEECFDGELVGLLLDALARCDVGVEVQLVPRQATFAPS